MSKSLRPIRPVTLVSEEGVVQLGLDEITAARVGAKAFGLSAMPAEWTVPFIVLAEGYVDDSACDENTVSVLESALAAVGIDPGETLMVRSSGANETMQDRGRLISDRAQLQEVPLTIRGLVKKLPAGVSGEVHWILQRLVTRRAAGQLSNERRVSRESRDWLLAIEQRDDYANAPPLSRIAVRSWRDGRSPSLTPMPCSSEMGISVCLKRVAMWGMQFEKRLHFEWSWNGDFVYLLQVDPAEHTSGVNPYSLIPEHLPTIARGELRIFRTASKRDGQLYTKLRNASIYTGLGYTMPEFYILDQAQAIESILKGEILPEMAADLSALTQRPLIIRTDGTGIPTNKYAMLPRSDELFSLEQATRWLLESFAPAVRSDEEIKKSGLCLIAHHFIPSVASAWAYAEPSKPVVRIESLWGIPEGLYWYSYDTFEVDLKSAKNLSKIDVATASYRVQKRRRYKGTFIGPDAAGAWIKYQTAAPYDWRRSIRRNRWLFEIAIRTCQIAEIEKRPSAVMWFVDNHREATSHEVLPWFHMPVAPFEEPKAAPRRKWLTSRDVSLTSMADWEKLKVDIGTGSTIERVVVAPIDLALVRNPTFAKELGELACSDGFVVELSGSVLSHAYYILQKAGARVECVDLFESREDVAEFNKLIRDKLAGIIVGGGEKAVTRRLSGGALVLALRRKLVEEAFEALDAPSGEELVGELADILEAIRGICSALGVPFEDVEKERQDKRRRRGGFDNGLMLITTSTAQLVSGISGRSTSEKPPFRPPADDGIISDPNQLPARGVYRKLDERRPLDQEIEKMLTCEIELSQPIDRSETLEFEFKDANGLGESYTLVLEMHRARALLRAIVRLRKAAVQLGLFNN